MTQVAPISIPPTQTGPEFGSVLGASNDGPASGAPASVSSDAEAIRALRTNLIAQHLHFGRRGLSVCAASKDVGCTLVATNLAIAFAQIGASTLLMDADMRDPGVHKILPPSHKVGGLKDCLSQPGSLVGDFIDSEITPNLSVMYAGGVAENAQELLGQEWFEIVINTCLRDYDVTIIDTPPANTSADAKRICSVAGYSLVVARRNASYLRDVKLLVDQLRTAHANVIGTVLNYGGGS